MDPQLMQLFLELAKLASSTTTGAKAPEPVPEEELQATALDEIRKRLSINVPNAAPLAGGIGMG